MRLAVLPVLGLALAGCDMMPGQQAAPSQERTDTFIAMVEGAGCQLDQSENDALLDPAGFSDTEASAISQQLIADGRAQVDAEGNLVLVTGNCL